MVDIIRLHSDPHAEVQRLLPWYVNGSLEEPEQAQVEAHLADCAECREDLETEQVLARQIRALPSDVERGWAGLKARALGASPEPARNVSRPLFGRRIPVGWAVAAQAASLALLIPILVFTLTREQPLYRTLGSAPSAASGNLVVIFRPDSPEQTLRTILMQNHARIVDGPTSTDAYVLHVDPAQRTTVLARLRSDPNVSLAQLIDGDAR
jgi:anti-sigma factor RsiW